MIVCSQRRTDHCVIKELACAGQNSRADPGDMSEGNLDPGASYLAVGSIGWANWGSAGELAWVVAMRESYQTDQSTCHSGSDPGLWVSSPQHPSYLWTVGACEGCKPADPKQQNLHYSGQQAIRKEPQWEPIMSGVAETRGHKESIKGGRS